MGVTTRPRPRPDEDDLLTRLRAGDEQAFGALVDEWSGWMLRVAQAHVRRSSVADEVVQETWLAVLQGLPGFRGEASLRTWVYRILLNQSHRRAAAEHRSVPFASLGPDATASGPPYAEAAVPPYGDAPAPAPHQEPEQEALRREVREVVTGALAGIPARQRAVVMLRDLDDHSAEEVCRLLDISAGNQRVLLHRGRRVLRQRLEHYLADAT